MQHYPSLASGFVNLNKSEYFSDMLRDISSLRIIAQPSSFFTPCYPFSMSLEHKDDAKLCLLLHFPPCIFFRRPLPLLSHYWSQTSPSKQHPLWKLLPRPPLIGQQQSCSDIENQVCLKSSKTSEVQSRDRIFLTSTACKSLCGDSFQFYDLSNILQPFPQWLSQLLCC